MSGHVSSKKELRDHFRNLMNGATSSRQADWLTSAQKFFRTFVEGSWGIYKVLRGEPNCLPLTFESHIRWSYPQMIDNHNMHYIDGASNVVVPHSGLLIPGLAFDHEGYRLGRGGGSFDRYLKNYSGLRVGVCFENQITSELPHEVHDERVNILLTEAGTKEIQWKF